MTTVVSDVSIWHPVYQDNFQFID